MHHKGLQALDEGARIERISALPVREEIARARITPEEEWPAKYERIMAAISSEIEAESGH